MMNEKYDDVPCKEIVTKERLYKRLDEAIIECRISIVEHEARLNALLDSKRNIDEYFDDLKLKEK